MPTAHDTSVSQNQGTSSSKEPRERPSLQYAPIELTKQKKEPGKYYLTEDQKKFLLTAFVFVRNRRIIYNLFEKKYGRRPYEAALNHLRARKKHQAYLQRLMESYENSITDVFLSSRRQRLEELGDLYEEAREAKDRSTARQVLRDIDDMMTDRKIGDLNIINLTQNNAYMKMDYKQLCEEEVKLVKELKHVMFKRADGNGGNQDEPVEEIIDGESEEVE